MSDKAKLIWDFRGPAAKQTAAHHLIHLKEYFLSADHELHIADLESVSEMWYSAFAVVDLAAVNEIRPILKPHRGQRYNPDS